MKKELKKRALHRAKIIQGQMKALDAHIEDDTYCMDILTQSLAIQRSLASLNKLILENHIRTHVVEGLSSDDDLQQGRAVEELLQLYELNNIRGR